MPNEAKGSLTKVILPIRHRDTKRKLSNNHNYMSLKKAIQDLINHSEQHREGPVLEKLLNCRECYPLPEFESTDLFVKFWQTYRIINTQAIYPSERIKKAYEVLVREVLSAKDAPTEQKDITRIAALAKLVVLSIEYTYEP